ncbi:MAG: hypothetical protein ACYDH5_13775 [Acidimicrobiales bacterium]
MDSQGGRQDGHPAALGRKTVTRGLSAEQMSLYGPWFDYAKLRQLLREIESLSLGIAERGEDWS